MALALSLPVNIPGRNEILILTFGVVALSLFVQSLSVAGLLRKMGLTGTSQVCLDYERALGTVLIHDRALEELTILGSRFHLDETVLAELRKPHEEGRRRASDELATYHSHEVVAEQQADARRLVRQAQLAALGDALHQGLISDESYRGLRHGLLSELPEEDLG
jgi:CPA1 family monovalent cation:H+ antiporter